MKKVLLILLVCTALSMLILGCTTESEDQRRESINARAESFARAESLYPVPQSQNFPLRKALVEYTERQDRLDQEYYIYVMGDNGNFIGYYVSKTQPISTNAFLSSTEDLVYGNSNVVMTAPSLDGIYYGGSGASQSDGWIIFDYQTDAMIIVYNLKLFVSDQPLKLDVKAIEIDTSKK